MAQAHTKPEFEIGDYVSWKIGFGKVTGHVIEKLTEPTKLGNRHFKASPEEPKYKIKSDKSGKVAIRNPETLARISTSTGGEHHEPPAAAGGGEAQEESGEEEEAHHAQEQEQSTSGNKMEVSGEEKHGDEESSSSQKMEESSAEATVDNVEVTEEPAWQLGGTAETHRQKDEERQDAEEGVHRLPHEELPQPGDLTDLKAAVDMIPIPDQVQRPAK